MDMAGNEIALFSDPQYAAYVRALTGVDGGNVYYDSGFGSSVHRGSHPGYTEFLVDRIDTILDSGASPQTQLSEIYKLHFFAAQLSQGLITFEGQSLGVMGTTVYAATLASAYDNWTVTGASLQAYITGLDRTLTDAGLDHNLQARLNAVDSFIETAHEMGHLTLDQYNLAVSRISSVQLGLVQSGGYQDNLVGQLKASTAITQISIAANFQVKQGLGIQVSLSEFLSYHVSNGVTKFAMSEDGYLNLSQFDKTMDAVSNFSKLLGSVADRLPNDLSHLDQATVDKMASILNSTLVGVGGGVLGDTVEFLNLSYDAIKTGVQTGDWSDLAGVIANYGVSVVLSAVMITTTVALAGQISVGTAAVVAAAWAVGGVIDAIVNGAQLLDKILTDLGLLDPNDLPTWYAALSLLFNPPSCEPLVIDLDGDGIELTSLGTSGAYFDLDGDGFAERTGWVGPDDGLLVLDENGNGRIDDIDELFGSQTSFGYQELKLLDSNGDNVINANDAAFGSLQIWKDANGDGLSTSDELRSLTDYGIRSLSLEASASGANLSGNTVLSTSQVTWNDGAITQSAEIVFALSQFQSRYVVPENFSYDAEVYALPKLAGYGDVPGLWVAMTQDGALKAEAKALIEIARSGNFGDFLGGMDDFLFDWAGVDNVRWMEEIDDLYVHFAYDPEELAAYVGDGYASSGGTLPPKPKGYVFSLENIDPAKLQDWLEENNLALPQGPFLNENGLQGVRLNPTQTYSSSGGRGGTQIILSPSSTEDQLPSIPAAALAFLQKMMGQDYRIAGNFIAPGSIMVGEPSAQNAAALMKSFSELKDHYTSHFLAQAAWSVIAREGNDADLGALAPFKNIFLNPLNQHIGGDVRSFALEMIEMFRSDGLGSDSSVLALLSVFKDEMPSLASQVVDLFDDIDRSLIIDAFGLNSIVEGTNNGESLSASVAALVVGYDGNDSQTGSGGNDTLSGGKGDDSLFGLNGNDAYVYARGDGHDTITEGISKGTADKIVFVDVNADEVSLTYSGTDLTFVIAESVVGAGNGGSILVKQTLDSYYSRGVENIVFADGTIWDAATIRLKAIEARQTAGNDTITGFNTNDTFKGGLGNDALTGNDGNDTYVYARGDGHDIITEGTSGGTADRIVFTDIDTNQVSLTYSGTDLTLVIAETVAGAGDGGSILVKQTLDSYYSRGVENIVFADGTIWDAATIRLKAIEARQTAGNDTITGFNTNDTFKGGLGNDALTGNDGNDTYVYARGDGADTITEGTSGGTADRIVFTDIDTNQVSLTYSGTDLTLVIAESVAGAGDGGSILVKQTLDSYYSRGVENIVFADGTIWDAATIRVKAIEARQTSGNDTITGFNTNDTFKGGLGNDALTGNDGNDSYVYSRGDGADTITEGTNGGTADTLILNGINPSDVTLSRNGNHLTLMIAESAAGAGDAGSILLKDSLDDYYSQGIDQIVFADGTTWTRNTLRLMLLQQSITPGNDMVTGFNVADVIDAGAGNDTISAGGGNDTITGGRGNDVITGNGDNDTYYYSRGDGADTITERYSDGTADTLILNGINPSDVTLSPNGNDVTLVIAESMAGGGGAGSVLLKDNLDDYYSQGIDQIVFANGTIWTRATLRTLLVTFAGTIGNDSIVGSNVADVIDAGAGNDTISAGGGNDTITGGRGNDVITGNGDSDTYYYSRGDGADTITERYSDGTADTLILNGINPSDVTLSPNGNDVTLVIAESMAGAGDAGSILLKDSLDDYYSQGIDQIVFADGTAWTRNTLRLMLLQQSITSGNDTVTGFNVADVIDAGVGNDTISAGGGNDTITGGRGDDVITGNGDSDTYYYSRGDGADTITERYSDGTADTLILNGINPSDVMLSRNGNHVTLVIAESMAGAGDAGSILLKDSLDDYYSQGIDQIVFADGTAWTRNALRLMLLQQAITGGNDTITGFNTNDTLTGGLGDDTLTGYNGNDTYVYARGDGNDTIDETGNFLGTADRLVFADINADAVRLSYSGANLTIVIAESAAGAGDGGSILVKQTLDSYVERGVESIVFANGTTWDAATIRVKAIEARQTAGNDTITGFNTNDTLTGGLGDDTLTGYNGNDTYVYARGDGNDTIDETGNFLGTADRLVFADINADAVRLSYSGANLTIVIAESAAGAGDGGSILVKQTLDSYVERGVESIVFANGTTWDAATIRVKAIEARQTAGNDTITGFNTNDTLGGGLGNDVLNGGDGDDVHNGGAGDDLLIGNNGTDRFDGGDGNDTLDFSYYSGNASFDLATPLVTFANGTTEQILNIENVTAGSGNDTITGSAANNTLNGGNGNDALNGGIGNDVLNGGDGDDVHNGGLGNDLLIGNVGADKFDGGDGSDTLDFTYYSSNASFNLAASVVTFANGSTEQILNIENAIAGSGNDTITGSIADNTLNGGIGNDTLTGASGNDTFVFKPGFGKDTITDFTAGAASDDVIEFGNTVFANFEAVLAAASQVGVDTLITHDANNTITLKNIAMANLHADDFRFVA
ncbi:hypothetical protein AC244_14110 [Ensifer adhaerens]|uniref:Haemolysin-type calcium binding-related domain-containing protein n=2 Tax=Ensifer adhaerens TaxID=106592 RepID=A0A0L8BUT7_ENSAD|nr:hypothetical protein AC244_14110 [Ensifer adhaerens]